jgi:hypothetical protein
MLWPGGKLVDHHNQSQHENSHPQHQVQETGQLSANEVPQSRHRSQTSFPADTALWQHHSGFESLICGSSTCDKGLTLFMLTASSQIMVIIKYKKSKHQQIYIYNQLMIPCSGTAINFFNAIDHEDEKFNLANAYRIHFGTCM